LEPECADITPGARASLARRLGKRGERGYHRPVTPDVIRYVGAVVAFAFLMTAHLSLAIGLTRRLPRWHGLLCLIVPPLAPFWGYQAGLRLRSVIWVLAFVGYVVAWAFARFGQA
jgi:hypothetical protein